MKTTWLGFALPPALLVLLLWLPFGFNLHGLIEEWGVLGLFTNSGPVLFVKSHTMLEAHRLRPLTVFPHALAYLLGPDSFDSWHWTLIATLILKGAAASFLVATATRSPRWGVLFGLLFLLYPADTMQLSFRSLHINQSLALLLLGAALLVRAQDQRAGWIRTLCIALGACSILAAQLMYEVALMFVALPLIILWCRDGFGPTLSAVRKDLLPTLGWLAPVVLYVLYVLYASTTGGDSYQQTITDRNSPFSVLLQALPKLFKVGMMRALFGGWFDAGGMFLGEFQNHVYVIVFGLLCTACVVAFPLRNRAQSDVRMPGASHSDGRLCMRLAAAGLLVLMLGYLPYLFSPSHVVISQRTFLFASFGAAMIVLAVVMSLARLAIPLAYAAIALLLTAGAAAQLYQFHAYVNISQAQDKLLRTIIENVDGRTLEGKTLLVLDHSNQLSHSWFLRDNLGFALAYFYDRPMDSPLICLMPGGDWQQLASPLRAGHCREDSERWTFSAPAALPADVSKRPEDIVRLKSQVVQLVIDEDGTVVPDKALDGYRRQLATADTPAARRYRSVLIPSPRLLPQLELFQPTESLSSFRWDFGTWWSIEKPIRGRGWREAEWAIGYLRHDAVAWKVQEQSSLIFELAPVERGYRLSGKFDIVRDGVKDSLRLRLNGVDVPLVWASNFKFEAKIPEGALRSGTNKIEFDSSVDKAYYDLAARLTEFEIRPE